MADPNSAVSTLINQVLTDPDLAHSDVFRQMLQARLQDLIEAEATATIGAARCARSVKHAGNRVRGRPWNCPREKSTWRIPKLRKGSFFPSLLNPRPAGR